MVSSNEYLQFILDQLSELDEITYRAMMGEYIIYYRGKVVGGIYDDRLLVKPVKSAISFMPNAVYELPYDGAKEMLLVDDVVYVEAPDKSSGKRKQKVHIEYDLVGYIPVDELIKAEQA